MATGLAQPGQKAADRRTRVAVFGGSKIKTRGRRTQAGKVFNRRGGKPANAGAGGPKYVGAGGADLGLNDGVVPEGNLYDTWTPETNPYTGELSGPFDTGSGSYQIGTLSTGAQGYYDPSTGKFQFYDPMYNDDDGD